MTKAFEPQILTNSPIDSIHQQLGATMMERDGWSVPGSYGDVLFEYATVREGGSGVIDLSNRGRILVSGAEAVQFLNGLITNDMKTLAENTWMPAAFPNVQGRLLASVRVVRLKDEGTDQTTPEGQPQQNSRANVNPTFLIDTEPATHERVLKTIERFTLAGDFRVSDITGQTGLLSVQGRRAVNVVRSVLGDEAASIAPRQLIQIPWQQNELRGKLTVFRATHTAEDGFDLVVSSDQAGSLWHALQSAGARPVGYDALEILRIEAGLPRYGVDMDDTNVVTEAALDDAVSYTKGCYIGQEIIARIKYRGHVAKKSTGLVFDQLVKVEANTNIKSTDDKDIGRITSRTYSPHLGRTVALAYLKYDYLAPGTSVKLVCGDEELNAHVTELPFVRGS
jgi:folate-binding protein YgfZ